ncbi:MAG: hypothetical protein KDI42_03660 [Gammaproteobacteria bacterium]|nr:hypothetical protein [Gammaproteobacteria bacterium]
MKNTYTAILLGLLFVGSADAEITIPNLIASSRAVSGGENYDSDYQFVKSNYPSANGPQLFYAAVVEAHIGNEIESLKYLIAGQIRSTTDMSLFKPATESDKQLMAELYGMIFYQFGGAGGNAIYQDEAIYTKVFENILSYTPVTEESYSPGWGYTDAPSSEEYSAAISKSKDHRIKQLTDLVALLQNEEYVALNKELEELQKQPDGGGKRALELINKMRGISGAPKVPMPQ